MELNIQLGRLWKHNELAYLLLSTSCVKRCWFILKVSHRDWISYQFFTINIPKYKISHFCYWIVIVTSRILNAQAEVEPVPLLVVWHGKLDNHNFGCFTTKEGREWQTTNPLIWLITYSLLPSPPPPKYALHETYWSEKGLIRQKFSRERDTSYTVIWKLTQKVTRETYDFEMSIVWQNGQTMLWWICTQAKQTTTSSNCVRFDVRYCTSFWPWLWLWNETIQRRIMTRLVTPQLVRLGFMCSHL